MLMRYSRLKPLHIVEIGQKASSYVGSLFGSSSWYGGGSSSTPKNQEETNKETSVKII